jgi:hypothetical protein
MNKYEMRKKIPESMTSTYAMEKKKSMFSIGEYL